MKAGGTLTLTRRYI